MKIAVLTVTFNDGFKLEQWQSFYNEYKDSISYHIIIDNKSDIQYLNTVKQSFSNSIILERESNGGSTTAYNDGIRYALEKTDADAIMLLGNDIKISGEDIVKLWIFLNENKDVGMVAPIMFNADSNIIADFGCNISKSLVMKPYMVGKPESTVNEGVHYCTTVTGGVNMARTDFFKKVGLQDEKLFMYSDEVDIGLRATAQGYKAASISNAKCWHQHINHKGSQYRKPFSSYLVTRNKVYLAKKHNLKLSVIIIVFKFLYITIKLRFAGIFKCNNALREMSLYTFKGLKNGLVNDMSINEYVIND